MLSLLATDMGKILYLERVVRNSIAANQYRDQGPMAEKRHIIYIRQQILLKFSELDGSASTIGMHLLNAFSLSIKSCTKRDAMPKLHHQKGSRNDLKGCSSRDIDPTFSLQLTTLTCVSLTSSTIPTAPNS